MITKKILVCDDEPHIVHVVAAKLRNAGMEVITASDGQEGFDLAKTHLPDMVVTDYQMPFLSGLEMCVMLRCEPATQHIPIIMLTARGLSLGEQEMAGTNIRRVLVKPFSPREVLTTVQDIVGARDAEREASPA